MFIRLLSGRAYSSAVVQAINSAHNRVYIAAFALQPCTETDAILEAVVNAQGRGVASTVIGDASSFHYEHGKLALTHCASPIVQSLWRMTRQFCTPAASLRWVTQQLPFLFAGRMHSKWIVADDMVFSFGGINLDPLLLTASDYMLAFRDPAIADVICRHHESLIRQDMLGAAVLSRSYTVAQGTIHIDGGLPGDSVIYRRALDLVRRAIHVSLISQYCPSGRLAASLHRIPHDLYYNVPAQTDSLTRLLIRSNERRHCLHNSYTGTAYIHGKCLVATLPDGHKVALTGSHNFVTHGVWLGTHEIALETTDKKIIASLERFITKSATRAMV